MPDLVRIRLPTHHPTTRIGVKIPLSHPLAHDGPFNRVDVHLHTDRRQRVLVNHHRGDELGSVTVGNHRELEIDPVTIDEPIANAIIVTVDPTGFVEQARRELEVVLPRLDIWIRLWCIDEERSGLNSPKPVKHFFKHPFSIEGVGHRPSYTTIGKLWPIGVPPQVSIRRPLI